MVGISSQRHQQIKILLVKGAPWTAAKGDVQLAQAGSIHPTWSPVNIKGSQAEAIHDIVAAEQHRRTDRNTNEWKDYEELMSLSQVVTFELMRGAVKKNGLGLGWGSRAKQCQSAEQEERRAMLWVFKEI